MGIKDKNRIYEAEDLAPGQTIDFRRDRRNGWRADERRAFLWRRHADFVSDHDAEYREGAIHREHPFGQESGREGEILVGETSGCGHATSNTLFQQSSEPQPETADIPANTL